MRWLERTAEHRWDVPYLFAPGAPDRPVIVALHGMGENEAVMARRVEPLAGRGFALLVPRAPHPMEIRRPDRIRIGYAWYHYDGDQTRFVASMTAAAGFLLPLVDRVAREAKPAGAEDGGEVGTRRRVLVGFSQGAYLAYYVALRYPERFAACCGIAGRAKDETLGPYLARARHVRVLHLHGADDPAVRPDPCRESIAALAGAGLDARFELVPAGHEVSPEMVEAIGDFAEESCGDAR